MNKIMRPGFIVFFILLSFTHLSAADIDDVLSEMEAYWEEADTFVCDFTQTKHLSLFEEDIVSTGTLSYRKPGTVPETMPGTMPGTMIWRYNPPDNTIMALHSDTITLYFPELNKAKIIQLKDGEGLEGAMTIGIGSGDGDKGQEKLKEKYDITLDEGGDYLKLVLVPGEGVEGVEGLEGGNGGDMGVIDKIIITLDVDFSPIAITIMENMGDTTTIEFSNRLINLPVDDETFELTIPPGTEVEEIGG